MVEDDLGVARGSVRRETHQLVFATVDAEPAIVRKRRVQEPERMREMLLLEHGEAIALAAGQAGSRPFTHAVQRQYRRLFKWRWEERAGRMRFMMLREYIALAVGVVESPIH